MREREREKKKITVHFLITLIWCYLFNLQKKYIRVPVLHLSLFFFNALSLIYHCIIVTRCRI